MSELWIPGSAGSTATSGGGPVEFGIGTPILSRLGAVERSEDLRDPARIASAWPSALMLLVDESGRVGVHAGPAGTELALVPAVGAAPPPDAVLLGRISDHRGPAGLDVWAVSGPVPGQAAGLRELGAVLSDTDAGLLTSAVAVLGWHQRSRYCGQCGGSMSARPAGWSRACPEGHEEFPRTDPAVIVLVHDGGDRMVLARQPGWAPGRVSVLAGFVEAGESLEATVCREIAEEVGLTVGSVRYLASQPWPFPRSLMVGFSAIADPGQPLVPRDGEIAEAFWTDRATVRRALADPADAGAGFTLPPSVSIARRMVESWAGLD